MSQSSTDILTIVDSSMAQYGTIVSNQKWALIPKTQLEAAKRILTKNLFIEKIACGNPQAVNDALIQSATLGLDLTEGKRQGWLLPRKNQKKQMVIQLQVGYKGVEVIHQNLGVIDRLEIRVVRQNDDFKWSGDSAIKPDHTMSDWFGSDTDRGPIKGAFSITHYPDKSIQVMVASITEIYEKHRNISDSWKDYETKISKKEFAYPPPWVTYEKTMVEKTMAYIASKQWPANIRDKNFSSKILETLHETDTQDYSESFIKYTDKQKSAFDTLIETDDSLGMYLFQQYIEIEVMTDLISSFEKGNKTSGKDNCRKMTACGAELFINIAAALDKEDGLKLNESLDGANDFTVKLLKRRLDVQQLDVFSELYLAAE
jgi:recombinational DNA repair protein RecT